MSEEKKDQNNISKEEEEEKITLPKPEFSHLVETFGTQALMYLGKIMNPLTNKVETNLQIAKYQIDILEILEDKTKGNLTSEEESMLSNILNTVRMTYIDVSKEEKKEQESKQSN